MKTEVLENIRGLLKELQAMQVTGEKIAKTEFGLVLLSAVSISRAVHGSRSDAVSAVIQMFDALCRSNGKDPLQVFEAITQIEVMTREDPAVDPSLN